ncbi:GT23 domain-containing protein [Meloidogyne graminicola]|uniref:GT23 domain-containing protein n=1 Tax=Meloidogyne graminicola TaxID=189291 RepID=A0A8T0A5Q7_9BILA|nr:GT23 domain-containing protein [Meloidogyne graminicola]
MRNLKNSSNFHQIFIILFYILFIILILFITQFYSNLIFKYFNLKNINELIENWEFNEYNKKASEKEICHSLKSNGEFYKKKLNSELNELFNLIENSTNKLRNEKIYLKFVNIMAIGKNISINLNDLKINEEKNQLLNLLGDYFYNKIFKLQNPKNCKIARFLVCKLEQFCGFGCVMHHISFCLSIALGTNRTLIFEDDGIKWSYKVRWNDIFEQITNCNYKDDVLPWLPIKKYKNISTQIERHLFLDRRSDIPFEVNYQPEVFPKEFAEILFNFHSNPSLWFHGQLIKYIWRESAVIRELLDKIEAKIPFVEGPIVGIHVRRTDKYKEARTHNLKEYFKWTDFWYDIEYKRQQKQINYNNNNITLNNIPPPRIFIASEEPKSVIEEAKKYWNGFEEGDPIRYTKDSLLAIMAEIKILSQCQFVVCTFSSNVCRLIYELMQAIQGKDMSEAVQSLDVYYTESWKCKNMEVIDNYNKLLNNKNEINANKGDIIEISRPLWNGFVYASFNLELN